MSQLTQTLQDLPATGLIPVAVLVIIGLVLWSAGRKILRFGFAVVGLVIGGLAGWLVGETLNLGVATWITTGVGALTLAFVAALAFRVAVAGAMAIIFAIAAPMGVITYAEIKAARAGKTLAEAEVTNPFADGITNWLNSSEESGTTDQTKAAIEAAAASATENVSQQLDRATTALNESVSPQTAEHIEDLKRFSQRMIDAIRAKWDSTPQSLRPTLMVSSVAGGFLGLIVGAVASTLSAAAITAVGGSLLWLCGVQVLAVRLGVPEGPWFPKSGSVWLIVWLITSIAGVVIQWTFRKRPADKPA